MTRADEAVLAYLEGIGDDETLDVVLRAELAVHPDEVTAALLLLRVHGALREGAPPAAQIMERVRDFERRRVQERALAAIRILPALRVRRSIARVGWAVAALLAFAVTAWWSVRAADDHGVRIIAGALSTDDGRLFGPGPLPHPAMGKAATQGVVLAWTDGSQASVQAGSRLRMVDGVLAIDAGSVRCAVMPQSTDRPFRVITPDAAVEVIGTEFTITVGDEPAAQRTSCRVERGTVIFRAAGRVQRVEAGETMTAAALADGPPAGWRLVFADEFSVTGAPDTGRWQDWSRPTGPNGDLQRYLGERARVADGFLCLTAARDAAGWSSAALLARGLRLEPGMRVELRANMSAGPGAWPLVWGISPQRWPAGAEAVFLTTTGDPPHLRASLRGGDDMQIGGGPALEAGFHTYASEWTAVGLTCWRDGVAIGTVAAPRDAEWPGASADGLTLGLELTVTAPADAQPDERRFEIDWIRVYRAAPPSR